VTPDINNNIETNAFLDLDACLPQPCENNGTCVNKINGFECFCADGYEGYRCQNGMVITTYTNYTNFLLM
jgi:hypothetical protein